MLVLHVFALCSVWPELVVFASGNPSSSELSMDERCFFDFSVRGSLDWLFDFVGVLAGSTVCLRAFEGAFGGVRGGAMALSRDCAVFLN